MAREDGREPNKEIMKEEWDVGRVGMWAGLGPRLQQRPQWEGRHSSPEHRGRCVAGPGCG